MSKTWNGRDLDDLAAQAGLLPTVRRDAEPPGDEGDPLTDIRAALFDYNAKHDAILRDFRPPKTTVAYKVEGATFTTTTYNIPKDRLGGVYLENRSGATAHVYLGSSAFGEPYLDVPAGQWKALPVNAWGESALVTLAIDAQTAGRLMLILSSESLGPGEGNLAASGGGGTTNAVSGTLINGAALAGTNYTNGVANNTLQRTLTLLVSASAACIVTIEESIDGLLWYAASIAGTLDAASITFNGAGSVAVSIPPAPWVRVRPNANVNLSAQYTGG